MRKPGIHDAEATRIALRREILRSKASRFEHRLHGVLLVYSGRSYRHVAELLGHSPRTIRYWVQRFERFGVVGLQEGERPGRPAAVDAATREQLGEDLRRSPREWGYANSLWDGALLSHHLAHRYAVQLGVRQCQRMLHTLGVSRRTPRRADRAQGAVGPAGA